MSGFGPEIEVGIARLRAEIAKLHSELPRYDLVVWTGGNISGRVAGADLFVIKPSGVSYDELAPENMILCDLDGNVIPDTPGATRSPSVDTATHAYVYRTLPEVGGIAHTHSPFAVAWSSLGEGIPCIGTTAVEEFGPEIPLGPAAATGDGSIGRGIAATLAKHRSPAVLMGGHGPFTLGPDARAAVKSAVLVEDAARVAYLARQLAGAPHAHPSPTEIPTKKSHTTRKESQ
ncbi:L-ribulose-5-phosphate 4-epimerase [Herbiconiux sp. KACC 21604]|uniref:L-ribulose-5-phosphate 4-epimerase n=1 Tax=unclassified Herbiconiux TaxID=2618217 RepID=UPI0014913A51|nr:L-ribulose-5-phosphate 4-epimerase [Herbiconiux sp. SALV-R1]QJU54656.1 L-ribulose-5-phosphate 4-epimerase [Herbiconiux sp. SALV-R1]WPO85756.1 L-ribulose-5-phosphate 4-epimerase [Herbiconiux sp. KACC 21604]